MKVNEILQEGVDSGKQYVLKFDDDSFAYALYDGAKIVLQCKAKKNGLVTMTAAFGSKKRNWPAGKGQTVVIDEKWTAEFAKANIPLEFVIAFASTGGFDLLVDKTTTNIPSATKKDVKEQETLLNRVSKGFKNMKTELQDNIYAGF